MCNEASFVLTEENAYWSETSDSHSEIIKEHNLRDTLAGKVQILACEITPPVKDDLRQWTTPLNQWTYRVDESYILPDWYSAERDEARARAALRDWVAAKLVLEPVDVIVDGHKVAVCADVGEMYGGTIRAVYGGTISEVHGGTIREVHGGTIRAVYGGTISAVCGGTIRAVHGGTIRAVYGGTISAMRGGTIRAVCGGTISAVHGGVVTTYRADIADTLKAATALRTTQAVLIYITTEGAQCFAGGIANA